MGVKIYFIYLFFNFFFNANSKLGGFLANKRKRFLLENSVELRLPDDPLRWNFSRRFSTRDLGYIYIYIYMNFLKIEQFIWINFVAVALQGDTLAPYLFIFCLDYVLRTCIDKIKENCFKLTKERNRMCSAKNNYLCRLRRRHSASGKSTRPSPNLATLSGTSHCSHRPPCQCRQDEIYVL